MSCSWQKGRQTQHKFSFYFKYLWCLKCVPVFITQSTKDVFQRHKWHKTRNKTYTSNVFCPLHSGFEAQEKTCKRHLLLLYTAKSTYMFLPGSTVKNFPLKTHYHFQGYWGSFRGFGMETTRWKPPTKLLSRHGMGHLQYLNFRMTNLYNNALEMWTLKTESDIVHIFSHYIYYLVTYQE